MAEKFEKKNNTTKSEESKVETASYGIIASPTELQTVLSSGQRARDVRTEIHHAKTLDILTRNQGSAESPKNQNQN